jgi:uncharacterized protein (TIGR02594 family)
MNFQKASGLVPDGIVGPKTRAALFGSSASRPQVFDVLPWLDEVRSATMGLHERRDNKELWDWLKSDGKDLGDPKENPWCGSLVQTAFALTIPSEPLPSNPWAAINWLKFGVSCDPRVGAVLVFWRGSPTGWQGHVGFYVGEDATHYHVLGGNQSDQVSVARIAKNRLRPDGCRWPKTVKLGAGGRVVASGDKLVVTDNEA